MPRDPAASACFDVERILGRRFHRGREEYLVKWAGFPEDQSTWEPVTHLLNVLDMLEAFNEQLVRPETRARQRAEPSATRPPRAESSEPRPTGGEAGEPAQRVPGEEVVTVVVRLTAPQVRAHKWVQERLYLVVAPDVAGEELVLLSHEQARAKLPGELCDYYAQFLKGA